MGTAEECSLIESLLTEPPTTCQALSQGLPAWNIHSRKNVGLWPGLGFRRPACVRPVGVHGPISLPPKTAPFQMSLFCDCHFSTGGLCDPLPHKFDLTSIWTFFRLALYSAAGPRSGCPANQQLPEGRSAPFLAPPQGPGSDPEVFAESNTVTKGCQLQVETGGHPASYEEHQPESHRTS